MLDRQELANLVLMRIRLNICLQTGGDREAHDANRTSKCVAVVDHGRGWRLQRWIPTRPCAGHRRKVSPTYDSIGDGG